MKGFVVAVILLTAFMGFSKKAQASVPTSDLMTCSYAIHYYKVHHRIYVIANGHTVVPIYGLTPISEARGLNCGASSDWAYYDVVTSDSPRCYIGVYCL